MLTRKLSLIAALLYCLLPGSRVHAQSNLDIVFVFDSNDLPGDIDRCIKNSITYGSRILTNSKFNASLNWINQGGRTYFDFSS
jgi:hypothetical protein